MSVVPYADIFWSMPISSPDIGLPMSGRINMR